MIQGLKDDLCRIGVTMLRLNIANFKKERKNQRN